MFDSMKPFTNQTQKCCLEYGDQIWQSYFFSSYTTEVKGAIILCGYCVTDTAWE